MNNETETKERPAREAAIARTYARRIWIKDMVRNATTTAPSNADLRDLGNLLVGLAGNAR